MFANDEAPTDRQPGLVAGLLLSWEMFRDDGFVTGLQMHLLPFLLLPCHFGMIANCSRWREAPVNPSLIALSYHSRA
jgi:hypothetical protein